MSIFCIFSPRLRQSDEYCNGTIRKLEGLEARSCGFAEPIFICFHHVNNKQQQNMNACCYPCQDKPCSGSLVPCPQRLFPAFDQINSKIIGTFICAQHLRDADRTSEIASLDLYCPPNTRKVRNVIHNLKQIQIIYNFTTKPVQITADVSRHQSRQCQHKNFK